MFPSRNDVVYLVFPHCPGLGPIHLWVKDCGFSELNLRTTDQLTLRSFLYLLVEYWGVSLLKIWVKISFFMI